MPDESTADAAPMSSQPYPPPTALASTPLKRFACDRCRSRKIRCPRPNDDVTTSCTKCIRSRVPCVTSAAKPPGRPTASKQSDRTQRRRGGTNIAPAAPKPSEHQGTAHSLEHQTDMQPDLLLAPASSALLAAHCVGPMFQAPVGERNETAPSRAHIRQAQGHGMFDYSVDADVVLIGGPGRLMDHFLPGFDTPSPPPQPSSSTVPAPRVMRGAISPTVPDTSLDADGRPTTPDPGILLASLYKTLCEQLPLVWSAPLELGNLGFLTSVITNPGRSKGLDLRQDQDDNSEEPLEVNYLSTLLHSMTDFLEICRLLKTLSYPRSLGPPAPRLDGASTATADNETGHNTDSSQQPSWMRPVFASDFSLQQHSIPTAQLLTVLSSYLHLTSICEAILSRMLSLFDHGTTEAAQTGGYQSSSKPTVPPVNHKLFLRLFAQTVEYHLEQLEDSLGLPQDRRVTRWGSDQGKTATDAEKDPELGGDRTRRVEGLLAGREAKALLSVVMRNGQGEGADEDPGEGLKIVDSLRACLRRVYSS
ncbi:hypothetical protein QBC44DRAFT_400365 [Cladorrhinum sp. PSN332]|nr:hypothetical protein QBC44DRAFT_400365 [Cladorrhinum sp. PSN332]